VQLALNEVGKCRELQVWEDIARDLIEDSAPTFHVGTLMVLF